MDMATVYRTFNSVESQVIRGRLEAAGIPASVRNEQSTLAGGAGVAGVEYLVDVPQADAAAARVLIEEAESPDSPA